MVQVNDGTEGGPDDGGVPGGGPDVRTGSYDGDSDNDIEEAGSLGGGKDVSTGSVDDGTEGSPDPAGSTGGQPMHPAER